MTVGLEKLVQDIKNETSIWPIEKSKNTPEEEAAWDRVGARNKMSGNHVKSIFKVLSKKYESEKSKPNTNWKLFEYLKFLDEKNEPEVEEEEDEVPDDADLEDDGEFVELLEVNEYDESEDEDNESAASGSAGQTSRNVSMEDEQQIQNKVSNSESIESISLQKSQIIQAIKNQQQKSQTSTPPSQQQIKQLKGIEVKKVMNTQTKMLLKNSNEQLNKKLNNSNEALSSVEAKLKQNYEAAARNQQTQNNKQQQRILPESSLKRKMPAEPIKKGIVSDNGLKENTIPQPPPAKKLIKEYNAPQGLKIERIVPTQQQKQPISETISGSSQILQQQILNDRKIKINTSDKPSAIGHPSSTNDNVTEIKEIISPEQQKMAKLSQQQNGCLQNNDKTIKKEIIENDEQKYLDNPSTGLNENIESVLPSFFRDLYNSKKYDCFGMYVASAMNRLPNHLASKLETKILKAIIEVNSLITNDD